jgi:hypothetical protein
MATKRANENATRVLRKARMSQRRRGVRRGVRRVKIVLLQVRKMVLLPLLPVHPAESYPVP